jgi:hypothetical protein
MDSSLSGEDMLTTRVICSNSSDSLDNHEPRRSLKPKGWTRKDGGIYEVREGGSTRRVAWKTMAGERDRYNMRSRNCRKGLGWLGAAGGGARLSVRLPTIVRRITFPLRV